MSYELMIGGRYLYRGTGATRHLIGLVVSVVVAIVAAVAFFSTGEDSGIAVIALAGGLLSSVLFTLLCVLSVFTTVSVLGVVLGVAALTIVLAVTTGFQRQFEEKILGVNAHIIIMKSTHDFDNYREIEKLAWEIDPQVEAVHPFIFVEMLVTRGSGEQAGAIIKGVDPDRVSTVLDLHKHLIEGSVDSLKGDSGQKLPPIILGQILAEKLKVGIDDVLTVVAPDSWSSNEPPRTMKFRVSGIFYSGFDEYDRRLMYISLGDAQSLLEWGDRVMGVELKVSDVRRADEIADKIAEAIDVKYGGAAWDIKDWHELNKNLFTALTLQKFVLLIVLTLIVLVAAFNMVSALTMMVIDKTREVAILKSMGANAPGIAWVFQIIGLAIGGIGTVFGVGIGLALCEVISRYDYRLDPKVYLIDRLPVSVNLSEVLVIGAITMVISAVATLFPAIRASALRPVEGLRYD